MAFTNLSVKDAALATKTVASHLRGGSDHFMAHVFTANSEGGCLIYRNADLDETGVVIKASAGQVYSVLVHNANAAVRYLKLYNKATAATAGDTPVATILLPVTSQSNIQLAGSIGAAFSVGISARCTTGLADADTGAPSANDIYISVFYF